MSTNEANISATNVKVYERVKLGEHAEATLVSDTRERPAYGGLTYRVVVRGRWLADLCVTRAEAGTPYRASVGWAAWEPKAVSVAFDVANALTAAAELGHGLAEKLNAAA
ncbi:MAG TPA: hypothetical protein VF158_14530 [Longimicrobiales bacterium]